MFSKSDTGRKRTSTRLRWLEIRRAYWRLSGPLQKTLRLNGGKSEKVNMNEGSRYGFPAMYGFDFALDYLCC